MNGRKRHILVDTNGLLLGVLVHPANIHDRDGALALFERLHGRYPGLSLIWADNAYRGHLLDEGALKHLQAHIEVTRRPGAKQGGLYVEDGTTPAPRSPGFQVVPRRWVVERTFAWQGRNRRLSKDYEGLPETEEAFIYLAMVALMARRMAL